MEETKDKPCPFCGSQELMCISDADDCGDFYCYCDDCLAEGPNCRTEEEAIEKWNNRSAATELSETIASLLGEDDLKPFGNIQ